MAEPLDQSIEVDEKVSNTEETLKQKLEDVNDVRTEVCQEKSITKEVETCFVCYDEMENKTSLGSCGHSLCARCTFNHMMAMLETFVSPESHFVTENRFTCPYCRGFFDVKELKIIKNTEDFVATSNVNNIMEKL